MIFNTHYPYIGGSGGGVPQFQYTGQYSFIDDGSGNWRIKFLTSGVFTPLKDMTIDAFLVGGGGGGGSARAFNDYPAGGGGGGGGYAKTIKAITLTANTEYAIEIGDGGSVGSDGGATTAFANSALGGSRGHNYNTDSDCNGGNGGSGGGQGGWREATGQNGGYDGSSPSGTGQGTTTKEFGEETGDLYSGGGGGGSATRNAASNANSIGGSGGGGNGASNTVSAGEGKPNTGGGGGGGGAYKTTTYAAAAGGSGIVIIRKHK